MVGYIVYNVHCIKQLIEINSQEILLLEPFCRLLAVCQGHINLLWSGSCVGLQQMVNVCSQYDKLWDICFHF